MKGPDAPLAGGVLRDFTPRGGEVAFGRPTNPLCVPHMGRISTGSRSTGSLLTATM